MSATKNPCTKCGKPGIPGLIQGAGKCQYHWNVGAYGQVWADRAEKQKDHHEQKPQAHRIG